MGRPVTRPTFPDGSPIPVAYVYHGIPVREMTRAQLIAGIESMMDEIAIRRAKGRQRLAALAQKPQSLKEK